MTGSTSLTAQNGRIPDRLLTPTRTGQRLLIPAAGAYARLDRRMRDAGQGALTLSAGLSGYRTLAEQQRLIERGLTTVRPGRSIHGEGLAADFQGLGGLHGSRYRWLRAHAGVSGWFHPRWAQLGGSNPSAHHWEYDARLDREPTSPPPAPTPPEVEELMTELRAIVRNTSSGVYTFVDLLAYTTQTLDPDRARLIADLHDIEIRHWTAKDITFVLDAINAQRRINAAAP